MANWKFLVHTAMGKRSKKEKAQQSQMPPVGNPSLPSGVQLSDFSGMSEIKAGISTTTSYRPSSSPPVDTPRVEPVTPPKQRQRHYMTSMKTTATLDQSGSIFKGPDEWTEHIAELGTPSLTSGSSSSSLTGSPSQTSTIFNLTTCSQKQPLECTESPSCHSYLESNITKHISAQATHQIISDPNNFAFVWFGAHELEVIDDSDFSKNNQLHQESKLSPEVTLEAHRTKCQNLERRVFSALWDNDGLNDLRNQVTLRELFRLLFDFIFYQPNIHFPNEPKEDNTILRRPMITYDDILTHLRSQPVRDKLNGHLSVPLPYYMPATGPQGQPHVKIDTNATDFVDLLRKYNPEELNGQVHQISVADALRCLMWLEGLHVEQIGKLAIFLDGKETVSREENIKLTSLFCKILRALLGLGPTDEVQTNHPLWERKQYGSMRKKIMKLRNYAPVRGSTIAYTSSCPTKLDSSGATSDGFTNVTRKKASAGIANGKPIQVHTDYVAQHTEWKNHIDKWQHKYGQKKLREFVEKFIEAGGLLTKTETMSAIASVDQKATTAIASVDQKATTAIASVDQKATTAITSVDQKATTAIASVDQKATTAIASVDQKVTAAATAIASTEKRATEAEHQIQSLALALKHQSEWTQFLIKHLMASGIDIPQGLESNTASAVEDILKSSSRTLGDKPTESINIYTQDSNSPAKVNGSQAPKSTPIHPKDAHPVPKRLTYAAMLTQGNSY